MFIKRTTVLLGTGLLSASAAAVIMLPGTAAALESPTTGQPGAPNTTCFTSATTSQAPGQTTTAHGSPFNGAGQAGGVYAGNPGTASSTNSNSAASVSQYDVACLQVTTH